MHHDPCAISSEEEFDLTDCFEDGSIPATPHIQASTGWLTKAKARMFIHGCKLPVNDVLAQAYRALRAPNIVEPHLGLDKTLGQVRVEDVRSLPIDRDEGYATTEQIGGSPDYPAIVQCLLQFQTRIRCKDMIYLIVDNRDPGEVPYWPAFEQWWLSRCRLVGPHHENTDVLWITANLQNGLWRVPYYWAGVFVLEVARFLYPQQHFGLVNNDCVPVTLFEVPDLIALATGQTQWRDLVGMAPDDPKHNEKVGLLLVTEAHLEYNAGLLVSIGSQGRPCPITSHSSAEVLAEELADYRLQLLAMARPPVNPTDCSQGGTMFTPLVGVPMGNSLDLVIAWAMYGSFMCKTFWPLPSAHPPQTPGTVEGTPVRWPKRAHPGALSQAGQERTPWLTRWARATFEQGCLSVLPHLEGKCKALSLPGEHLFQASRILPNRTRPVIFHAFGKAKHDAPKVLNELAQLGWETLPIALLGMPQRAAWVVDTWKPIGGCSFAGSPAVLTGNSPRVRVVDPQHTPLGQGIPPDPDVEPVEPPRETNSELLARQLLQAATDQNSQECGSQAAKQECSSLADAQVHAPYLFVPWKTIAKQIGIPEVHATPLPNLKEGVLHAAGLLPECLQQELHAAFAETVASVPTLPEPVETLAPLILTGHTNSTNVTRLWASVLQCMADYHEFWLTATTASPPDCVQIHCGGLGGGTLSGMDAPTFDCTNPRVDGTCVYGPSLAPVDRSEEKSTGVAAGATTCLHELAMLMSLTAQPCERWQELGFGRASVLYRRTQIMLEAARLLPAHRRLPHVTFLNGLWWKLLALQPERVLACLPKMRQRCSSISAAQLYCPTEFKVEGFSAGSYTGAVIFLALRRLFPECRISAKLGAVAMPKGVFAFLQTMTFPGRCRVHLIHAEDDLLCNWQPNEDSSDMLSRTGLVILWSADPINGWAPQNTNTSTGYVASSHWGDLTLLILSSGTRKSYLSGIGWLRHSDLLPESDSKQLWTDDSGARLSPGWYLPSISLMMSC